MPSAKSFTFEVIDVWKMIDVNQKRRGPKIKSRETQALIVAYSDDWPLIKTV